MDEQIKTYGSRVIFAFRNFPLYTIHPDAGISHKRQRRPACRENIGRCTSCSTKRRQPGPRSRLARSFRNILTVAQQLGLNVSKFDQDINSTAVTNKIAADAASGNAAQIDHTPTFFVNNAQIQNPTSEDAFKQVIDAALAAAGSASPMATGLCREQHGAIAKISKE